MDDVARMQAIDASQARITNITRQTAEALENQRSHSVSHQIRTAGRVVGIVGAGAMGAPGILADLSGYLAGKSAEELTVLLQALSKAFGDAHQSRVTHGDRHSEIRNEGGLFPHVHLARQEV